MKTFAIFVAVFALAIPTLEAQTAYSANGAVTVNYDNGTSSSLAVAIAGIESGQSFSGNIMIGGRRFDLPLDHSSSVDERFYRWKWKHDGISYKVTILLGNAEVPFFTTVTMVDAQNPTCLGSGRSSIY